MKPFYFFLITLFISLSSFSQPFEGGFFAGVSASQVDGDTYAGYNKLGLTAGGYISGDIKRNRNLKWKAELRYIQKGAFKKTSLENPDYYRLAIHYVEIPFLLQFYFQDKLYLEAGFSPDVYLFHREEDEYGEISTENGPEYHRFGVNAHAGIGYFITDQIILGIRNSYSVIPMREHASGQTYLLNRGQYNNVLGLSLYYHFK